MTTCHDGAAWRCSLNLYPPLQGQADRCYAQEWSMEEQRTLEQGLVKWPQVQAGFRVVGPDRQGRQLAYNAMHVSIYCSCRFSAIAFASA